MVNRAKFIGIFVVLFFMGIVFANAQSLWSKLPIKPVFSRLGVEEGLSQGTVHAIIQDQNGYLWFGTESGLNRYDGQEIVVFTTMNSGLQDNHITSLTVDLQGGLWIGTEKGGLHLMSSQDQEIRQISHLQTKDRLVDAVNVRSLMVDRYGFVWIATAKSGLFRCEPDETGTENLFFPIILASHTKSIDKNTNPDITALHVDQDGTLWLGTRQDGLFRIEPHHNPQNEYFLEEISLKDVSEKKVIPYILDIQTDLSGVLWIGTEQGLFSYEPKTHMSKTHSQEIGDPIVRDLFLDRKGLLWMATDGSGIASIVTGSDGCQITFFVHIPGQESSLSVNATEVIYEDCFGVLWIGTFRAGLNQLVLTGNETNSRHRPFFMSLPNALVSDPQGKFFNTGINAIIETEDESLWLGTENAGLLNIDFSNGKVLAPKIHQVLLPHKGQTPSPTVVTSLAVLAKKTLWIGTYTDGLFSINLETERQKGFNLIHYPANTSRLPTSPPHPFISSLLADDQGDLWIGSVGGGLSCIRKNKNEFEHAPLDSDSQTTLSDRSILALLMDRKRQLWIGTAFGLNILTKPSLPLSSTQINPLISAAKESPPVQVQTITALFEDHTGQIWVGTQNNGLFRINRVLGSTVEVSHFTSKQYLCGDMIAAITEDARHHLWISTSTGICSYDPIQNYFVQFSMAHGLPDNEFFRGSVCSINGRDILFGSQSGAVLFNPLALILDPTPPMLVFRGIWISGPEKVKKILSFDLQNFIQLRQNQFPVSIEFSAIHTVSSDHVVRQHRLDKIDSDWQQTPNNQAITYPSLPTGTFQLSFRAANRDKLWTPTPLVLKIKVSPPFWRSVPAIAILVFLTAILLSFLHFWRLSKAVRKERQKYEKTLLSSEQKNAVITTITDHAKETKCFTDPGMTLTKFARSVGLPAHNVSQAINSDLEVSFPDFINELRINFAKSLIENAIENGTLLKIHELSSNAGFRSQATFNRAFKKTVTTTPSEYYLKLKLLKAQSVLLDENNKKRTFEEVAQILGFSSEASFSRLFKKQFGLTPYQFKKRQSIKTLKIR